MEPLIQTGPAIKAQAGSTAPPVQPRRAAERLSPLALGCPVGHPTGDWMVCN